MRRLSLTTKIAQFTFRATFSHVLAGWMQNYYTESNQKPLLRRRMNTAPLHYQVTGAGRGILMKAHILVVGEDPALLKSRALLLEDWETSIVSSLEAKAEVKAHDFDLILLCHTVAEKNARELIQEASLSRSTPIVLAIRFPGDDIDLGVETHTVNVYESPGWLPTRVSGLMAGRTPSS
jgi:hypothetical protein